MNRTTQNLTLMCLSIAGIVACGGEGSADLAGANALEPAPSDLAVGVAPHDESPSSGDPTAVGTISPAPTLPEPTPVMSTEPEPTIQPEPTPGMSTEPEPTIQPEPTPGVSTEPTIPAEPEPAIPPEPTMPPEPEPAIPPEPTMPPEPEPGNGPVVDPALPSPVETNDRIIERVYKVIHDRPARGRDGEAQESSYDLKLWFHLPENFNDKLQHPAAIFFYAGSWVNRNLDQFERHAEYLASRGMIGIIADYRVRGDGGTPSLAVADAKSAVRYLRANQQELRIDPEAIVAAGGSAGGHLAAATDLIEEHNDPDDDLGVSPRPQAVLLFNSVIDNGPGQFQRDGLEAYWESFSPRHNIRAGAAPTVHFLGTNDRAIPIDVGEGYCEELEAVGTRCTLHLYEGQGHGFFNQDRYYPDTMFKSDEFLASLGLLEGPPTIENR